MFDLGSGIRLNFVEKAAPRVDLIWRREEGRGGKFTLAFTKL